jgi:putative PIN family toxin of toxin-antitoxin system
MGAKKIVIDTNTLISAIGWNGKPRELFRQLIDKKFELQISIKQIAEIKRVLNYSRLKFTEQQKSKFLEILFHTVNVIHTQTQLNITADKDDNMILECAVESKAEYIITGDDDLLRIKEFKGIKIVTTDKFLKEN